MEVLDQCNTHGGAIMQSDIGKLDEELDEESEEFSKYKNLLYIISITGTILFNNQSKCIYSDFL